MASIWNHRISISMFGEAQGPAVGVTVDNLPAGEFLDLTLLRRFLERREPGVHESSDFLQIMSGVVDDRTTGSPLCAFIQNPQTKTPENTSLGRLPRPGQADYTGTVRYRGFNDVRGGGHLSGKLMTPLCFAGAVCGQILERRGIYTGAHALEIHGIMDEEFHHTDVTREDILAVRYKSFPVLSNRQGKKMLEDIRTAAEGGETLGGTVECVAVNVPAGIGSPVFEGLENTIAQLLFGIPGVRGVEFGTGFACAKMSGSQSTDSFYVNDHGAVRTRSNNHGGILGGISSGMPIVLRVAFMPPPNGRETVNLSTLEPETLPPLPPAQVCSVPGAVPCVEGAVNIALLCHLLDYPHFTG